MQASAGLGEAGRKFWRSVVSVYEVSQATVNRAIAELAGEGRVTTVRG